MSVTFSIVIPARLSSSRLPEKALLPLAGQPMIAHVAQRALQCGAEAVVVATDDARIAQAAEQVGVQAVMTDAALPSGTDRIHQAVQRLGWTDDRIIVNVQGDEPLVPLDAPQMAAQALLDAQADWATLAHRIQPCSDEWPMLFDPNAVKVVCDDEGRALLFSRAPVPWSRDGFAVADGRAEPQPNHGHTWLRHIGMYAYQLRRLRDFSAMPEAALERTERLEQLRALAAGWHIQVAEYPNAFPAGVDTEADRVRVEQILTASLATS